MESIWIGVSSTVWMFFVCLGFLRFLPQSKVLHILVDEDNISPSFECACVCPVMYSWSAHHVSLLLQYQPWPWSICLYINGVGAGGVMLWHKMKGRLGRKHQQHSEARQTADRVRKEGHLLSHWETERQDADGRGCVGPAAISTSRRRWVKWGGWERERERGREETADVVCLAWIWKGRKGERRSWRHPQRGKLMFVLWGDLSCRLECHRRTLGR